MRGSLSDRPENRSAAGLFYGGAREWQVMQRRDFAAMSVGALFAVTSGPVGAQISLDLVPDLLKVRASAENDLKQVHVLAKYSDDTASTPPVNLVAIDGQYDDLAAAVNGYLQALSAAVQLPRPLDDKKWKTEGDAVVAQAQKFDAALQQLKAQAGTASAGTRSPLLATFASVLGQIILPGSTLFQNTKKAVDQANAESKKAAAAVIQSALWRDAATVLGTPPESSPRPQAR